MKFTKLTNLLILALVVTLPGAGCRKRPTPLTMLPGARAGNPGDLGPGKAIEGANSVNPEGTFGIASNPPGSHEGWKEDAETLKGDTVHFDYAKSIVRANEKPKVLAVGAYL